MIKVYKVAFIPHAVLATHLNCTTKRALEVIKEKTGASDAEYHRFDKGCDCAKEHCTVDPDREVNHVVLTDPDVDFKEIKGELTDSFSFCPIWSWIEGEDNSSKTIVKYSPYIDDQLPF